jgi:hypothetical protein
MDIQRLTPLRRSRRDRNRQPKTRHSRSRIRESERTVSGGIGEGRSVEGVETPILPYQAHLFDVSKIFSIKSI